MKRTSLTLALMLSACSGAPEETTPDAGPDELPCEVREVLEARCVSCHTSPPNSGATISLLARRNFLRRSPNDPSLSVGQLAAQRLRDSASPMPPLSEPRPAEDELAVLEAWVSDGMPAGSCGEIPGAPAPTTCASGSFWTPSDGDSEFMNPGLACRSCHELRAPDRAYFFMGTVFPALHEKDNCEAPPPADARVEILDQTGAVRLTLVPNAVGNFNSATVGAPFPLPYRARLVAGGNVREMNTLQRDGDCNVCHTEAGASGAPGRIYWP